MICHCEYSRRVALITSTSAAGMDQAESDESSMVAGANHTATADVRSVAPITSTFSTRRMARCNSSAIAALHSQANRVNVTAVRKTYPKDCVADRGPDQTRHITQPV